MSETLTVPIGPNASFDGGPYAAVYADGIDGETDPEAGVLHVQGDEGNEYDVDIEDLGEHLSDEMRSAEPISLNTGDVGEPASRVGEIDLPLVRGFTVTLHALDGQGKDITADLGNLEDDENRRRHFERHLKIHGGGVESV